MSHLSFSAPTREWVRTANGFCSQPWSPEGIKEALKSGAWFTGQEDIDPEARKVLRDK